MTTATIDLTSDLVRSAIRIALFEVFDHERAPEGVELFAWRHVPLREGVNTVVLPVGFGEPYYLPEGERWHTPVDGVEITPQVRGQFGYTHPILGEQGESFWVGWNRYERVGVIACGDKLLFPGDPKL